MTRTWTSPPGAPTLPSDQAFGNAFDAAVQRATVGLGPGEIPLFRALAQSLCDTSSGFHVEEYHGNAHQVGFPGRSPYSRSSARCELSDLLIVVYSARCQTARFTYLQAKSERAAPQNPASWDYKINLEQWDLLSSRPDIKGIAKSFKPPPNLLSSSLMPSIGSFGIFYQTTTNGYQLLYSSADCLTPIAIHSNRQGRASLRGVSQIRMVSKFHERNFTFRNQDFGRDLFGLRIGEPLLISGKLSSTPAAQWLGGVIRNMAGSNANQDQTLISRLSDHLASLNIDIIDSSFGAKRLVLIGSDVEAQLLKDQEPMQTDPENDDPVVVFRNPLVRW